MGEFEYKYVDLMEGRRIRYTKAFVEAEAARLGVSYERLAREVLRGGYGEIVDDPTNAPSDQAR